MRTTLTIDDDLMREIREIAHREGVSLGEVVNRMLRRGLEQRLPRRSGKRYRSPTFDLGRPRLPLDKALQVASALEDEEIVRKMELRK